MYRWDAAAGGGSLDSGLLHCRVGMCLIEEGTQVCAQSSLSDPSSGPCRRSSAANTNRVPRTIPEEGGPIPLHRDTTICRCGAPTGFGRFLGMPAGG